MTHGPPLTKSELYIKSNFASICGLGINNFRKIAAGARNMMSTSPVLGCATTA